MRPVSVFVEEVRAVTRSTFVRAHPEPILLHLTWASLVPQEGPGSDPADSRDDTASMYDPSSAAGPRVVRLPETVHLDFAEAAPLVKRPGQPFPERIYVGRAPDSDIVVRRPSISKSHAYFQKDKAGWKVVDCGSHNRTMLGGVHLAANRAYALTDGIALCFGAYPAFFLDSAHYYDLLRKSQYSTP